MSGSTIGGIAGVGISIVSGGVIPPNVGWMVGSVVGGLAFPPKGLDGPKPGDAKVQGSEWGRPIPWVFSVDAVAGNVIWQGPIVEREGDSGGGKGGGEPTTNSYFGNFAVLICEGRGGMALGRIWAGPDKRLVYDPSGTGTLEGGGTLRFYSGAMDQLPDPLIEAHEGVGEVPAWRGWCYVVFEDFPLNNDGNTIPFLTIEVGREGTAAPPDLGTVFFSNLLVTDDYILANYSGSYQGVIARNLSDYSFAERLPVEAADWAASDIVFWDEDRDVVVRAHQASQGYRVTNLVSGAYTDHTITGLALADYLYGGVYHAGSYVFGFYSTSLDATKIVLVDPVTHAVTASYTYDAGSADPFRGSLMSPTIGAFVVGVTRDKVRLYDFTASGASTDLGARAPGSVGTQYTDMDPTTDLIWTIGMTSTHSGVLSVNVHHVVGGLLYSDVDRATLIYELAFDPFLFVPGDAGLGRPNRMYIVGVKGGSWNDQFVQYDADSGGYMAEFSGIYNGNNELGGVVFDPVTEKLVGLRNRSGNYAVSTSLDPSTLPLSTGYMGGADSSLQGETLAEIVTAISEAVDLTAADIDVSQLTDEVDGFKIASQMRASEAIAALMPAYYFDPVESGTKVKFVKRGGAVAATIPDEDLGAYESDSEPANVVETTRKMEDELPRTVTVNYSLRATDYSPATRYARRLIGSTGDELTLDLPLVLTDTKGQEVADVNLYSAHVGRIDKKFSLGRAYGYLEPTDVVVVKEERVRIQRMVQAGAIYRCEAVRDDAQAVVPNVVVTETPDRDQSVETPTLTRLELM